MFSDKKESLKNNFNRFLRFKPLRGSPVEMTKAQILISIGISRVEGLRS